MPNHEIGGMVMHVPSIGIKTRNIDDLIIKVKKGLPVSAFEKLRKKLGVSDNFLSQIVNIPKRTLTRRKQQGRLNADESEKVLRIARLYDRALEVFEDQQATEKWLKEPARGLGEATPLKYARTELGAREVERLLTRIEYGVFPG
jgi:putative toxin-antitoxin system antitoxin component (TIGR02293 family)